MFPSLGPKHRTVALCAAENGRLSNLARQGVTLAAARDPEQPNETQMRVKPERKLLTSEHPLGQLGQTGYGQRLGR